MSENEEPGERIPYRAAEQRPLLPAPEEGQAPGDGRQSHAAGERSADGKRRTAFTLAVLALGWNFTKRLFGKTKPATAVPAAPEETGRAADRNLTVEHGANFITRERWGTLLVAFSFAIGIAAGFGFLFIYWTGGNNLLLGGTLALCLGGFGLAAVLAAHWLMPEKLAIEPREKLPSSPEAREESLKAFCAGAHDIRRRKMLEWMAAGGLGLMAAMFVSLMRSFGASPDQSLFSTIWKPGQRLMTVGGKPITVNSLEPGSSIVAFPENSRGSERTQTMLIRVREDQLQMPPDRANWVPKGYVAYSRVCTHAGCPVALFEATTNLLLCPCHQSTFDVLRAAQPTGGPAARPLPQLPLYVDSEGNLRAAGGFSSPPGPGFWGMPS